MNQTIQLPNIREFMSRHLVDVFETMLTMQAVLVAGAGVPPLGNRVTGSVAFVGDNINGAVYLHLGSHFAAQVAATMLGVTPEDLGEAEINDAVGEAANMLTGGLKSWLCDSGARCAVSTPAVIRGSEFVIEPAPDVTREWFIFECNQNRIAVEIHVKVG